ncbi:hypothetical protein ACLOJK_017525 [Asimina triloba]
MRSLADEDSSAVALTVKEEIEQERKQDDETNENGPENSKTRARGGYKAPPEATTQVPKANGQNEHVVLDVAAPENSGAAGRPTRKAAAKAMLLIHAAALYLREAITQVEGTGPDHHVLKKEVESMKERVAAGWKGTPATRGRGRAQSTIYQVPRLLRQVDEKCYEPQLISIGPYHHGKEHLQSMEGQKLQHLRKILSRNKRVKLEQYKKGIMKLEQGARMCYSSESVSKIPSDKFVEMMLLDGCFLVEIFLQNNVVKDGRTPEMYQEMWLLDFISNDMLLLENQLPYFVLNCIYKLVVGDQKKAGPMAKLVLDCFEFLPVMPLNKAKPVKRSYHHLVHLLHHHCSPINGSEVDGQGINDDDDDDDDGQWKIDSADDDGQGKNDSDDDEDDGQGMDSCIRRNLVRLTSFFSREPKMHLDQQLPILHLHDEPRPEAAIVMNYKPKEASTPKIGFRAKNRKLLKFLGIHVAKPVEEVIHDATSYCPLSIHSAEELEEAGITFKLPKPNPDSFLSIVFQKDKGVIQIPYLYFADDLHSVFQNLVAFEQCSCSDASAFFVGYVVFMDCLISSDKDVKILRHSKVLEHGLGSDGELADVFNRMGRGVCWDPSVTPLADLYKDINHYYSRRRNRWRAYCIHNYCKTPCATISLLAAIFLLILTATQTYFTIFPRS